MKISIILFTIITTLTTWADELSSTHTYSPLEGEWIYARASEASTLFIETKDKGMETFFHIQKDNKSSRLVEKKQGEMLNSYPIKSVNMNGLDIEIAYDQEDNVPLKTLIYPYRDIDNTWVIIHYREGENDVHFITPSKFLASIDYLDE